jgi:acyl carrier protein
VNISEIVTQVICEIGGLKKDQLTPDTNLLDELHFDELDMWEILCELEGECQVDLDDIEFEKLKTPKEIEDYVATKT